MTARQTSKKQTKIPRFMLTVHDLLLCPHTVNELRKQHVSIGQFLSAD